MTIRNLAAVGLVLALVGGPLALVGFATVEGAQSGDGLARLGGIPGTVGLTAVWLGAVLLFAALLQFARTQRQLLRSQGRALDQLGRDLAEIPRHLPSETSSEEMADRLAQLEATLTDRLEVYRRELLQVVDARILGIHETLREASVEEQGSAT